MSRTNCRYGGLALSAVAALAFACSARPAARSLRTEVTAPPATTSQPPSDVSPLPIASAAMSPVASASPPNDAPMPLALVYAREVDSAATAIALEEPPYAAALGADRVFLHDANGWRSSPLPSAARANTAEVELSIFYGRDDRVRLVGTRRSGGEAEGLYFRFRPKGFEKDAGEIGRLSSPRGALLAVLGTLEPEIVCRPGDICLVKRRSGWATVKAPDDLRRVALGGGVGWAIAGHSLFRLGDSGFQSVGPAGTWEISDALFATRDRAWVVETEKARIHAWNGAIWAVTSAPLTRPRSLWGVSADALWLAGEDGLAFFDGATWKKAVDPPTPLAVVTGRSADDVWIAGGKGVFRIERPH